MSSIKEKPLFISAISILGFIVGIEFWQQMIFPVIGTIVGGIFISKIMRENDKDFLLVISLQIGQIFAVVAGAFILSENINSLIYIDMFFLTIGIVWLISKPSILPSIILFIYYLLGIIINLISIINKTADFKSLLFWGIYKSIILVLLLSRIVKLIPHKEISNEEIL